MNALKPVHFLILIVIVLLLFGAKRLPDLAKSVGQSLKIFKNEIKDLTEDSTAKSTEAPAAQPGPAASVVVPPVVVPPVAVPPVSPPASPPVGLDKPVAPPVPPAADGTDTPRV